jgi:6-phosphofructokinase 2
MTVLTITLNPSIDVSTSVSRLEPVIKMRCASERRDPGGGGLNVARVLNRMKLDVVAFHTAAGALGAMLSDLVAVEGLKAQAVQVSGVTRENFHVTDEAGGDEYRFVLPGSPLSEQDRQGILQRIGDIGEAFAWVVISGSLPQGAEPSFMREIAECFDRRRIRLVVDTSGAALKEAADVGVFLMKPNVNELEGLVGRRLDDLAGQIAACRELIARGATRYVALSRGSQGACLVSQARAVYAPAIDVPVRSSIGAGDSFLAGILAALIGQKSDEDALAAGIASGTAALLRKGTCLASPEDTPELYARVRPSVTCV